MRHEAEIKRAHDVLGNVLSSRTAIRFDGLIRGLQQAMADSGYRIPDQNLPNSN